MKMKKLVYGDLEVDVFTNNLIGEFNPVLPKNYPKLGEVILISDCLTFDNGLYMVQGITSIRPTYYLREGKLDIYYRLININSKKTIEVNVNDFLNNYTYVGNGKMFQRSPPEKYHDDRENPMVFPRGKKEHEPKISKDI